MYRSLCILGRQSSLSLAELESLFGAPQIQPISEFAALLDAAPSDIPFTRLGGTMKLGKVLTELPTTNWHEITEYLTHNVPQHTKLLPEGKIKFGISAYGLSANPRAINAAALEVKKAVKASGRSIRVIPNSTQELNSAQVLRNKLTDAMGMELILVKAGNKTILAQTFAVQDIDAYAGRDHGRPKRDARVGMLPPKLAQTIINLAVGKAKSTYGPVILDPFCGTGVILQEATLMGFDVYGTDLDQRMVDYTDVNLMWLLDYPQSPTYRPPEHTNDPDWRYFKLEAGDATSHKWSPMPNFIACETYLGRPFSTEPKPETLQEVMQDVDTIHRKFLLNVARQTKSGFRMCIAVPAWKTGDGFWHLKVLDSLEELGYTRISFVHTRNEDHIYHREGQIVARELVVLIRK